MGKQIDENGFIRDFNGEIDACGTSLQGYFITEYKTLKKLFGEPGEDDGYKTDAEWHIKTPAGTATIYNYKDGKNYLGSEGLPKTKITEWHIGGADKNVYAWVCFAILRTP